MAETTVNNGVNVEALLAAREALKSAPEAARFKWRASCKWQNGTHSETKIEGFHGLGQEQIPEKAPFKKSEGLLLVLGGLQGGHGGWGGPA